MLFAKAPADKWTKSPIFPSAMPHPPACVPAATSRFAPASNPKKDSANANDGQHQKQQVATNTGLTARFARAAFGGISAGSDFRWYGGTRWRARR